MKIGLPRLRLSRKLLVITLGITVLLGGTGMTALYFGGDSLLVEGGESAIGAECTDVLTMVVKTPNNHLRLRKFIRMETTSGHERVRTALRISGLLAKTYQVDLIHVSVLDTHGPIKRADMRSRAIGAEVLIALKPDNLPEMKSPAMASYYEGPVSDEGHFYGDKVVVDIDEIGAMMTAMRTIDEKPDCINPAGDAETARNDGHGKTDKNDGHAKPKEGEKPAEEHGEEPAKKGTDEAAQGAEPAKEQSFLDSMLRMVGIGSSEETPAEAHGPVADEEADAPAGGRDTATSDEGHGQQPEAASQNHEAVADEPADAGAQDHPAPEDEAAAPAPAGDDHAAEAAPDAAADDHGETSAKVNAHAPAGTKDHGNSKKPKPDEHAEAFMPVGD